jgi:hypothetical protein
MGCPQRAHGRTERNLREDSEDTGFLANLGLAPNLGGAPDMGGVADNTPDRPYMCVICQYTFTRSEILERHFQRRHMGEAPNMGGALNTEGEQITVGFEDLSIGESANDGAENAGVDIAEGDRIENGGVENAEIVNGADEEWTMIPEAAPMRARAENADVENAGTERERIDAGREMLPTSIVVRRERAERDNERLNQIAAALFGPAAVNHGMEREGTGGSENILNLLRELTGNAREEEMLAAAGPNMEHIENGRSDMAERIRLIEMDSQSLNAYVERLAQRERDGNHRLEISRRAFNAITAMVRKNIVEQRGLMERAGRIRESRERLGYPDENGGYWESVEREAIVRQEGFINEGMAMVRERKRFLREIEFLLRQERLLRNARHRTLNMRERQRLLREMETSLMTRENLVEGSSLLYTELLDALSEVRLQVERICYGRCNRLNNVRRSSSGDSA